MSSSRYNPYDEVYFRSRGVDRWEEGMVVAVEIRDPHGDFRWIYSVRDDDGTTHANVMEEDISRTKPKQPERREKERIPFEVLGELLRTPMSVMAIREALIVALKAEDEATEEKVRLLGDRFPVPEDRDNNPHAQAWQWLLHNIESTLGKERNRLERVYPLIAVEFGEGTRMTMPGVSTVDPPLNMDRVEEKDAEQPAWDTGWSVEELLNRYPSKLDLIRAARECIVENIPGLLQEFDGWKADSEGYRAGMAQWLYGKHLIGDSEFKRVSPFWNTQWTTAQFVKQFTKVDDALAVVSRHMDFMGHIVQTTFEWATWVGEKRRNRKSIARWLVQQGMLQADPMDKLDDTSKETVNGMVDDAETNIARRPPEQVEVEPESDDAYNWEVCMAGQRLAVIPAQSFQEACDELSKRDQVFASRYLRDELTHDDLPLYWGRGTDELLVEYRKSIRVWEVWVEGGRALQGAIEGTKASLRGVVRAVTFKEAIGKIASVDESPGMYNLSNLTYYGWKLHNNEQQAREAFG